jgi:hypothetical protein
MKIKWGSFIVEGRGKIGGHVGARNRGGSYLRVKVSPVNPQTVRQQEVRAQMTAFTQAWRGLTQAQRDAWNAAVDDFSSTDVFGDIRQPTGLNLYTLLNINLQNSGQAAITSPPNPAAVQSYLATGLTITVGTTTMEVAFTGTSAADDIHIWATPGVSPGVEFVKNKYRFIGSVAGVTASPEDIWALYVARFGAPTVGSKVFVKIVGVNSTTGQSGQASSVSAIVA